MSGNASALAFGFAFAPPFAFAPCDFGRPFPRPFAFAYGVIAVEDAEVLAGPYLGGGPVGSNGEIDLGLLVGAGFLGGGGPGFVVPCVSAR